jgi:hypothetical protein
LLVELADGVAQVGTVGDVRGAAAFLVAAQDADDAAGAGGGIELGDPRAAAGAAGEAVAVEAQLAGALLLGPVLAGDGLFLVRGVAGDPDQVPVAGVELQGVGAQHVLDVAALVWLEHHEADVQGRIAGLGPAGRHQQPGRGPHPEWGLAFVVGRDEHDVAAVSAAVAGVDAVRRGDQQIMAGAGHHAGGAEMVAAGVPHEQRADADRG